MHLNMKNCVPNRQAAWPIGLVTILALQSLPAIANMQERVRFPTVGVQVTSPAGWKRIAADRLNQIAMWIRKETAEPTIEFDAIIHLEIDLAAGRSAATMASEYARTFNGSVESDGIQMDGRSAV